MAFKVLSPHASFNCSNTSHYNIMKVKMSLNGASVVINASGISYKPVLLPHSKRCDVFQCPEERILAWYSKAMTVLHIPFVIRLLLVAPLADEKASTFWLRSVSLARTECLRLAG
jgi:spore coat polysaccharide biosynthesis protein SpsF (cytidylyltransferase family)